MKRKGEEKWLIKTNVQVHNVAVPETLQMTRNVPPKQAEKADARAPDA